MTTSGENSITDSDKSLEELLGHATPRAMPPAAVTATARAAVQHEWQELTRRRTKRRWVATFATAASFVLAITLVMNTWLAPPALPMQVATLEKSVGTIYLLGTQSELNDARNLKIVKSGETIVTADNAGVGLRWSGGGSLRLGAKTEVTFASADTIELLSGRVYFDSMSETDDVPAFTISTEFGSVKHIGTQFIAGVVNGALTVSVREGRVSIDGHYHDAVAEQGERVSVMGSRRPDRVNIRAFGPEWEWVEATAPVAAMGGRRLYDFLVWVSRETGLTLKFENDDVEQVVRQESVAGDISDAPRDALRQSLLTADLVYDIDDNGVISVRQAGN